MTTINEDLVRNALRAVMDPELGASVVDLNMVRAIRIDGDQVSVDLVLTVPDCPLAGWIVRDARQTLGRLPGVTKVEVNLLDEPWQAPEADDWQGWVDRATGKSAW